MLSNNGEEETSVGATIDENSEASSRDAASTSGLEEHETVDPPDDEVLPVHPAHDPLGYLSGPRPDFDIDQDTHPFDETELSQEGSCQSVSEAVNRVGGAVEEAKSTTNEGTPEAQNRNNAEESSSNHSSQEAASSGHNDWQYHGPEDLGEGVLEGTPNEDILERQRVLVQSTIEMVQDHPSFHNETCEQVRANAEMIVESIQTHLGERNQTIRGIRLDEFTRMVRLTLENNFILPDDGVPPNVNDNASRADSVSETAPTLQAQSNSEENSSNEPKRKGPQKCMYCGELRKGHVCSAIRSFDAWTWTETKENSHIPAEIQEGAPIGEQDREVEVSREEWTQCVPNHDLTSDLEHQEEREVAPSAKSQRRTAKIRLKKKRKTDDCSPPSEGRPREEQEKQEVDVEQPQSVTEDYAADAMMVAVSNVDTTAATEAFRASHATGESDAPHLTGNEAETQQQPDEPPSQDPNHESAPNRDDESSDSDEDVVIVYQV